MNKILSHKSIIDHADFGKWVSVYPDKLDFNGNSLYPYPIYEDIDNYPLIFPKMGHETCQFCGYVGLTRLWVVRTFDSKSYAIVGSECWKEFNPEFRNSKNLIRDVTYAKIRTVFIKEKHNLLKVYWKNFNEGLYRNVKQSAYIFSTILNDLTKDTERKDVKKMVTAFTIITRSHRIFSMPITEEIISVCKLSTDKWVREQWEE
tara:strand:+ start:16124 stop:16735 length:612 start_codon:yes stop_codon:yes gene_type:complete